jgi:hypothetical protein
VESCGLPDRINKLFGTKIIALLGLFVKQEKQTYSHFSHCFGHI